MCDEDGQTDKICHPRKNLKRVQNNAHEGIKFTLRNDVQVIDKKRQKEIAEELELMKR
jgi:hypothetical protein